MNIISDEGKKIADIGSYEVLVFNLIPEGGISRAELQVLNTSVIAISLKAESTSTMVD